MKKTLILIVILTITISCKKEIPIKSNSNSTELINFSLKDGRDDYKPSNEIAIEHIEQFFYERKEYINENLEGISNWDKEKALWVLEAAANYHFSDKSNGSFESISKKIESFYLTSFFENENEKFCGTDLCYLHGQLKVIIDYFTESTNNSIAFIDLETSKNELSYELTFNIYYYNKNQYINGTTPIPLENGSYSALSAAIQFTKRWGNALPINNLRTYSPGGPYSVYSIYSNFNSNNQVSPQTPVGFPFFFMMDLLNHIPCNNFTRDQDFWNYWLFKGWEYWSIVIDNLSSIDKVMFDVNCWCYSANIQIPPSNGRILHYGTWITADYYSNNYYIQTY